MNKLTPDAISERCERYELERYGKRVWVNGQREGRMIEVPKCMFDSRYGQDDFNRDIAAALKVLAEAVADK